MKKISFIIPVFNEVKTIMAVVEAVQKTEFPGCSKEIIIVDDGSTDGTRELLNNLKNNIAILFNERNRGKGYSVRRGLAVATGDYFAIQDADLEYTPQDYASLILPLNDGTAQIVFGRRFNGLNSWRPISPLQFMAHRLIDWISRILSGVKIDDPTSCYRVFDKVVRDYFITRLRSESFTLEIEMVALIGRGNFKYLEKPIHYNPRSYKDGKKIRWSDGLKIIWAMLRYNL